MHRFDSWFSSGLLGVEIATKVCMHSSTTNVNKYLIKLYLIEPSPDLTVKDRDQLSNAIEFF